MPACWPRSLLPVRAIAVAGELIEAARRRLAAPVKRRSRGGDPWPEMRARRDEALRDLALLIAADLSLEQRAARVVDKAKRYCPTPADHSGNAERQALARIAGAGLPVPGPRQLRRILDGAF